MPFLTPKIDEDVDKFSSYMKFWQRIEPQSRSDDITRTLQAQVRDPVWLLTRQWQTGEFKAEDAGSPIQTSLMTTTSKITRYRTPSMGLNEYRPILTEEPLEMVVEQENVEQVELFLDAEGETQESSYTGWRFRVQAGQQFIRELKRDNLPEDKVNEFLKVLRKATYAGIDSSILDSPTLDEKTRDFLLPIVGLSSTGDFCRSLDGSFFKSENETKINEAIQAAEHVSEDNRLKAKDAVNRLRAWMDSFYSKPNDNSSKAWQSDRLEYEFCVSAPAIKNDVREQRVLVSREYDGSDLDWFDFSMIRMGTTHLGDHTEVLDEEIDLPSSAPQPIKSIPTVLSFYGCPNHRWWRFEDAKTDFGALTLDKVDLGKLLVMEFALIHGNDWFVIPLEMEIGDLKRIDSLEVTNVFGEVTPILPVRDTGNEEGWNQWDLFSMSIESPRSADEINPCSSIHTDSFLFIPPTLGKKDENKEIEEVRFLRDEIANMVWGVEINTRNRLGERISGYEAFRERLGRERMIATRAAVSELTNPASTIFEQSAALLLASINELAETLGIEILDGESIDQIRERSNTLAEEGTEEANQIVQLIEKSNLGILWNSSTNAVQAAIDMEYMITTDAIISFGTVVIENLLKMTIPDEVDDVLKELIENTLETARARASNLGLRDLVDDPGPLLHYRLASVVPENWIPYIAVRQQPEGRQVTLFQARMLRNDPIAPVERIFPTTNLLISTSRVNEETVSRAGVKVNLGFQRTRWIDGSTHLWLGRSRAAGKGEGSSGLKFDYLETKSG